MSTEHISGGDDGEDTFAFLSSGGEGGGDLTNRHPSEGNLSPSADDILVGAAIGSDRTDPLTNQPVQADMGKKKGFFAKRKKIVLIAVGGFLLLIVASIVMTVLNSNNEQVRKEADRTKAAALAVEEMKQQQEDAVAAAKKKAREDEDARRAAEEAAATASSKATSVESQIEQLKIENANLKTRLKAALSAKPKVTVVERVVEKVVEKPVQPAPEPPKEDLPRSHCEFKGSLVNRAWLDCDGKLISVKAGDPLPYPYREVVKVNDGQSSGGSVLTTAGGVIE